MSIRRTAVKTLDPPSRAKGAYARSVLFDDHACRRQSGAKVSQFNAFGQSQIDRLVQSNGISGIECNRQRDAAAEQQKRNADLVNVRG